MSKNSLEQTAQAIQELFQEAPQLSVTPDFIQRQRDLTPEAFAKGLVLAWATNPNATLPELASFVAMAGSPITPQALHSRFTSSAASFLLQLLQSAVQKTLQFQPRSSRLCRPFNGVYLHDSSTLPLPSELKSIWPGCGGNYGDSAAIKLHLQCELQSGKLHGPFLTDGKTHDRKLGIHKGPFPKGSLVLNDLGYFELKTFQSHNQNGVYWISRLKVDIATLDLDKQRFDLVELLRGHNGRSLEKEIIVGLKNQVKVRLVTLRAPKKIAAERRRKLRETCIRKGRTVRKRSLELCDWALFITNIPKDLVAAEEIMTLYRVRWQIEILFRCWKKYGKLDKSRSKKPWRILCEVYAKLLGVMIKHYFFSSATWDLEDASMEKGEGLMRMFTFSFLICMRKGMEKMISPTFDALRDALRQVARVNKSKKNPRTWQLLILLEYGKN